MLSVSYSDLEEHAYHAIEALQSVAERRGETGVAAVRYVEGEAVYKISPKLLEAALSVRVNSPPEDRGEKAEAFLIRYRDGLQASTLNLNSRTRDYLFAARLRNDTRLRATCFYISLHVHSHWGFMTQMFENLVLSKRPQMPVERTLLANGILLAGLESRRKGGTWVDTPELGISYSVAALGSAAEFTVVDVQKVPVDGDPSAAIVRAVISEPVAEIACDVLIAGAGMGGVGAALAVARHNLTACVTEETDWVGGQATAGGVSALDENKFIEISGGTRRYYEFRNRIRQAYGGARNPGGCYVSALCFEPSVGVDVLDSMLQDPKIRVFRRTQVVAVDRRGDRIESALAWQFDKRPACDSASDISSMRPRWVIYCPSRGYRMLSARRRSPKPASLMPPKGGIRHAYKASHILSPSSALTGKAIASRSPPITRPSSDASNLRCG